MTEKSNKVSDTSTSASKKFSVPVLLTDRSVYEGAFALMKERFAAEMRRMDEEMSRFSTNLLRLNGQNTTVHAGMTSSDNENPVTSWDVITKSPLVVGEGEDKVLKLQFDVSEYDPNEVSVKILNGMLLVSAVRLENKDANTVYSEYSRELQLPVGTDPETVESSLSTDGILTVKAPLHLGVERVAENNQNEDEE